MAKQKPGDIVLDTKIALRIKELRKKINPNQKQFAEEHGMDRQLLNRWESTTDNRGVSIHTINRFCEMIHIGLKDFFDSDLFTPDQNK